MVDCGGLSTSSRRVAVVRETSSAILKPVIFSGVCLCVWWGGWWSRMLKAL